MNFISFIQILTAISMYTFIITSLLGAGLGLTLGDIIRPIKKIRLVLSALLVNFILIPAMAYGLSVLLNADASMHAGIFILACVAGAPFLPKLATIAKVDLAYSIGLMILLMMASMVFAPLVLPLLIPGLTVHPWQIAKPLIILMLLPLLIGLILRGQRSDLALKIKPTISKISSITLLLWMIFAFMVDYNLLISSYGTGIYKLTVLFTIGTLIISYLFGGRDHSKRMVSVLGAAVRNIPAALIISIGHFADKKVVTVVLIGSVVQFIFSFIIAKLYGRFHSQYVDC